MVAGVLGGLGEHYHTDPNIFRLIFLLFLLATGLFPGVILYLIAAIIIPEEPHITPSNPVDDDTAV